VVTHVSLGAESAAYLLVDVEFTNRSTRPVAVVSYDVTWPYGRFVAPDANLRLAPGQVAIRRARIEEFSLDRLTPANARATVLEVR
jgi:hypothetical protein